MVEKNSSTDLNKKNEKQEIDLRKKLSLQLDDVPYFL